MSERVEDGVLELPPPRRQRRHYYHDITAERLRREAADRGEPQGVHQVPVPAAEPPPGPHLGHSTAQGEPATDERGDDGSHRGQVQSCNLSDRLLSFYGGGDRPELRRMLFARLQYLVNRYGRPMEELVRECCIKAAAADNPGNYFCRVVRLKMAEATFWEVPL